MKRTLTLKSESLAELTPGDLAAVVGGAPPTLDVKACVRELFDTWQPTRCLCP